MAAQINALHANFDVDYVVVFRFTDTSIYCMGLSKASADSHL